MAGSEALKACVSANFATPSAEELLSTLREDAERVLRGVDALRGEVLCQVSQPGPRAPASAPQHLSTGRRGTLEARGAGDGRPGPAACRSERPHDAVDELLPLPPALASRWRHARAQTAPGSLRESQPVEVKKTSGMKSSIAPTRLDTRWRDAFISNEIVIDQQIAEAAPGVLSARSMPTRVSQSSYVSLSKLGASVPLTPYCATRLCWDLVSVLFMMYDMVAMPMQISWGVNPSPSDQALFAMVIVATIFWSIDLLVNLNTGFFQGGDLVTAPLAVFEHYLKTWMVFDVAIVALDFLMLASSSFANFGNVRFVRVIRFFRLARVAKLTKVNQAIEDVCAAFSIRWLILVVTIFKSLTLILFLAHVCACFWHFIGQIYADLDMPSWLHLLPDEAAPPMSEQYTRCLYWVLGHLTAAPVDATISPQNHVERAFTVSLIFCSLIVIGAAISGMTNTIAELGKLNSDFQDMKRQLQSYLKNAGVHHELSARIIQFATHSYNRRQALSLDASVLGLLSERLKSELAVTQRSKHFVQHPLFAFIADEHFEVFRDLCEAFAPNVYADGDEIFQISRVAKFMYVLHAGGYKLTFPRRQLDVTQHLSMLGDEAVCPGKVEQEITISEAEWLCEICLYTKFVHQSSLQSTCFGDAFTLSCEDLLHCVNMSPTCVSSVYRYAQTFLTTSVATKDDLDSYVPQEMASLRISQEAYTCMRSETQQLSRTLQSRVSFMDDTKNLLSSLWISSPTQAQRMSPEDMVEAFPIAFGELHYVDGVYAKLHHMDDRNRAISSMCSLVLLLQDRYSEFVALQRENVALTSRTWKRWQSFVKWVDLQEEQLHAVLVYLAIRGFGKMKSLVRGMPALARSPEAIVTHLMDTAESMVPSTSQLSKPMQDLVRLTLQSFKHFSLPQLLQGENTPSQVLQLQRVVESHGDGLLRFYLICQVGVMCGLGGARHSHGSSFMDEQNSTSLLTAISCLRQVATAPCHQVYWGYILARAVPLGLPTEEPEQLAVARLACLCRTTPAETRPLQAAWASLSRANRATLASNLLADGVQETAFVFTFLPLYLANAKANRAVGMKRALLVLVDILEVLRLEGIEDDRGSTNIVVDLQDVALLARDVQNPRIFLATPAHIKLMMHDLEVQVMIATTHRERVKLRTWAEDQAFDMPGVIRKLERKVDVLEEAITEPATFCEEEEYDHEANAWADSLESSFERACV